MFIMDFVRVGGELFDVSPEEIMSHRRSRKTVKARYAIQKAMSLRGNSTSGIGRMMDRDHTTIMHALRKADMWSENDPVYKERIEQIASLSGYDLKH